MKKLLLFIAFIGLSAISFAEIKVGSYKGAGEEWDVEAGETNGKLDVFVFLFVPDTNDRVCLQLTGEDNVNSFRDALVQVKTKYLEWSKIAIDNNVEEVAKDMDIPFPHCDFWWFSEGKWHLAAPGGYVRFGFYRSNGKNSLGCGGVAKDVENKCPDQEWYIMFFNENEVQSLIDALDVQRIYNALKQKTSLDDLFK